MKTQTRIILSLLLFAVFLMPSRLFAQPISPVHQGNLPIFMDELYDYFGTEIQIPDTDVEDFLLPKLPSNPTPNCPPPDPDITFMDSMNITFEWPVIPSADEYRVGFINLYTSNSFSTQTFSTNYNFTIPDGLYLFFFQSRCGQVWGEADIVIVDKVVYMEENRTLSCRCRNGTEGQTITSDYFDLDNFAEFKIKLIDDLDEVTHEMHFVKNNEASDIPSFDIKTDCVRQSISIVGQIMYTNFGSLEYLSFGVNTEEEYTFITSLNFPYDIDLKVCSYVTNRSGSIEQIDEPIEKLIIYPNPVGEELTVIIPSAPHGSTALSLFDLNGKIIANKIHPGHGESRMDFDTSQLPPGLYYLKISGSDFQEIHKISIQ